MSFQPYVPDLQQNKRAVVEGNSKQYPIKIKIKDHRVRGPGDHPEPASRQDAVDL